MYKCPCTKLYYEIIFHTLQSTCLIKKFRSFWGFRFALSQLKGVLRHFQEIFFRNFFCTEDTFRRLPKGWNENFSPLCLSRQPGGDWLNSQEFAFLMVFSRFNHFNCLFHLMDNQPEITCHTTIILYPSLPSHDAENSSILFESTHKRDNFPRFTSKYSGYDFRLSHFLRVNLWMRKVRATISNLSKNVSNQL